MGALYGSTLFICFNNAGTVQAMVSIERTVHYREKAAGMYSSIPYALAQVTQFLTFFFTSSTCLFVNKTSFGKAKLTCLSVKRGTRC
jgi:hypothetical protein